MEELSDLTDLVALRAEIKKLCGKEFPTSLGEEAATDMDVIPTGIPSLDYALGVGGIPRGRVVEIFGAEASGKTLISLSLMAEAQKMGLKAAFIDVEQAFDPSWAIKQGVSLDDDKLIFLQPDWAEQSLELISILADNRVPLIIVDSVAALSPKAEVEGESGDSHMGLVARLMGQSCRRLPPILRRSNSTVVFLNQVREKIGVMFGNPITTPGGRALPHAASQRISMLSSPSDAIKTKTGVVGYGFRFKVIKNKVAPPYRVGNFKLLYEEGIQKEENFVDMALELNIVEKAGAWIKYDGEQYHGKDNMVDALQKNPSLLEQLRDEIYTRPSTTDSVTGGNEDISENSVS
jgi:recombination protein RecA